MTGFSSVDLTSSDCTRQAFADSERHPDTLPRLPPYAAAAFDRLPSIMDAPPPWFLPRRMFFGRADSHGGDHDLRGPWDSPVLWID